ncbi:FKBP-type peptidyl-prolyl cis-trans isomerase [Saccharicrinis aurantiacus]|uniref:FKBP-type peptidyl-prolyl cis-trans isomerase n=1 Tax=Saccharicrinis aurantiacus TaxID=1849719 RepID=UPI0024927D4C|nr:FKBP-type peptidyl-prolyl cis-trans isomerase [Saccharicrinis aurantiacus]
MKLRGLLTPLFFTLLTVGIFTSCKKDTPNNPWDDYDLEEQLKIDAKIIEDYIAENDIDAENVAVENSEGEAVETGIYVAVTDSSHSEVYPNSDSLVEVKYKGYFTNGDVFEDTGDESIKFLLGQVIVGWRIGFTAVAEGDKATIIIPSPYAYGPVGAGPIGPNEVIIFDVELIKVSNGNISDL